MAKVVIHTTITLDGFMARPNDSLDWANKYASDVMVDTTRLKMVCPMEEKPKCHNSS
jgi:hypothetical protein